MMMSEKFDVKGTQPSTAGFVAERTLEKLQETRR